MFAVKGWAVHARSLKPQTEVFRPTKSQDGEEKKGKKRKRKHVDEAKQDPNVKPDDVGRLWERHVEGKDASKAQKKREKKKQKLDQTSLDESPKQHGERKDEGRKAISLGTRADTEGKKRMSKKDMDREQQKEEKERKTTGETAKMSKQGRKEAAAQDLVPVAESAKLTPMQAAMRQKLISARFRHLNQTLYTAPSKDAQNLFDQDPAMFEDYHAGFRQQVSVWPENPVDNFIIEIRQRGKKKHAKADINKKRKASVTSRHPQTDSPDMHAALPRTDGVSVIVDLGCGDARLARTLTGSGDTKSLRLKMHSFDLHSPSPLVTKADISALPLPDKSVDVALFCLALMGTNWISFIEEAHRILRWKGELWVAEIKSRFGRVSKAGKPVEHSVGGKRRQAAISKAKEAKQREQEEDNEQEALQTEVDGVVTEQPETDVQAFVNVLTRRGFILKPPSEKHVDLSNKMFVKMEFVKALTPAKGKGMPKEEDGKAAPTKGKPKLKFIPNIDEAEPSTEDEATVLKPCLYKLR